MTIKPWTASRYGGKDETTGTHQLVASGYYCKHHMAEKLESLTRGYRLGVSSSSHRDYIGNTGTAEDINLAATGPKK